MDEGKRQTFVHTNAVRTWILPNRANEVEYARARDVNFKSAKKMKADLDANIDRLPEMLETTTNQKEKITTKSQVPAPSEPEMDTLFCELSKCQTTQ